MTTLPDRLTAEIDQLRQYLDTAQRRAAALGDEVAKLREFAGNVLGTHREHGCCDIDGSDVQDWALAAGLLHEVEVTESCGAEDCTCMEYYGEITAQNPAKCLRLTDAGKAAVAARKGTTLTTLPPSPSPPS